MTRLIVDTDTAGDDVFSLLVALLDPRIHLEAITICCGNVRFGMRMSIRRSGWRRRLVLQMY